MIWQAPLRWSCIKAFYFRAEVHRIQTSHVMGHHGPYICFPVRHKKGEKFFYSLYYLAEDFGRFQRAIPWADSNDVA